MPDTAITQGDIAARFRTFVIVGNSMLPQLKPGQRVEYDTHDCVPSPPGLFIVWDGLGLVCQQIEFVAHSNPAMVRVSSANPSFTAYSRRLDEVTIYGRVIGAMHPV